MGRYIVVIEDESCVQELLRDMLEAEGDEVLAMSHGGTALELLRNTAVDLILLDLMLPDTTGVQVASALRMTHHRNTPIVAMSADRRRLEAAWRTGLFDAILSKPFDLNELLDLVDGYTVRRESSYA